MMPSAWPESFTDLSCGPGYLTVVSAGGIAHGVASQGTSELRTGRFKLERNRYQRNIDVHSSSSDDSVITNEALLAKGLKHLVLYDINSDLPGNYWSPNPAKPRFIMSYKGLPFVTIWVEYKDISIAMKSIGAKPNKEKRVDGSDVYSIPVLSDPNTGALITDSLEIASYLEKTYPEKPVFPNNSEAQIRAFDATHTSLNLPSIATIFLRSTEIMNPTNVKFFIRVRSMDHVPLPWEAKYDADWESLEKAHNTMYEWYQKSDGKWIMGDFSYADIIVACRVLWYKRVLKEDEWAKISSWNGGKWVQVLADVEKECNLA